MKISCLQENLAKGLGIVGRAVSPRSTLPVLGNVLMATEAGRLKLSATNLEVGISCWIGAKVEEEGAITVPARTLIDLVNALPPEQVDMELIERTQTLNLCAGRSESNIKGIDAAEFPIVPAPEGEGGIPIAPDVLRAAIQQVAFAAATDESRPILTGVLAKFEQEQLTLAAADGFRLSVRTVSLPQAVADPFSIIIPARALTELGRISGEQKDPIVITVTPTRNQVLFQLTDIVLVSQLIDGNFPDFNQIIPKSRNTHTVVDTASFLKACKTALIFARDAAHISRMHIKPGTELAPGHVIVSATSAETGDDVSELDASIEGDEVEVAFNVKYLIEVLSVVGSPQVALDTTTSSSPGVILPVGETDFTHVIMPMHLGR
ncbi:MAG: DNA polymerase III subunit beta [Chloroflexi bacterium]|nr:MAG: DNA polymerase III subunit beta [Anaerolineaceae bacterium 4572_32.2]RLC80165.1 MAG: DNA polymerase III subunit beta [Chloroflexota bacterium]RLC85584.1 MAG: DNA polymerase III subunit beta [Chloroflexota bacterium]HEY71965.1 DNA polymerase III subunit beta [Thermoflexia bacterium]